MFTRPYVTLQQTRPLPTLKRVNTTDLQDYLVSLKTLLLGKHFLEHNVLELSGSTK